MDSGASHNICNNRSCFISFKSLPLPITIKLGDQTTVITTFHRLVNISQGLRFNALYTPTFRLSLLSINQLHLAGYTTTFRRGKCYIFADKAPTIIANHTGNLYILQSRYALTSEMGTTTPMTEREKGKKDTSSTVKLTPASPITMRLWHKPLAHLHPAAMQSHIDGFEDFDGICDPCLQVKQKQKFIRTQVNRTTRPFKLVHSDTCGPFSFLTTGGHLHYTLFIDDYTHWTTVQLFPDKKQETCIAAYQHHEAKIDARGYHIKRFRCDNGIGEFDNRLFQQLLATRGTALKFFRSYAHHENRVAERMIRTITEKARAMILDSQAPLDSWGEAINTAVYLHQHLPNEGLTKGDDRDGYKAPYETPYKMLHSCGQPKYDKLPDDPTRMKISNRAPLHHLRRFGCYVRRLIPGKQITNKKLGASSKACMLVEYVHDTIRLWRIWDPEHNIVNDQSDAIFDDDRNAYLSCPQSLKRKNSSETELPDVTEEITEIDLFDLLQEEIPIPDIVSSATGESMDHGRTRSMSGTEQCMTDGRTHNGRSLGDRNPAARANSDFSKTGHTNNGHEH